MAPSKTRSLAQQLADLDDPTPKDFDPEDLERDGQSSDEEDEKPLDLNAGREHYQAVGKGKLRKQEPVDLGKEYAGARVSRDALEAESDDDPFAPRDDDDQLSDSDEDDSEAGSGIYIGDGIADGDSTLGGEGAKLSLRPRQKHLAKKEKTLRQQPTESDSGAEASGSETAAGVSAIVKVSDEDESDVEDEDGEGDEEAEESDLEDGLEDELEDDSEDESEDEFEEHGGKSEKRTSKSSRSGTGSTPDDRDELRRLMTSDQKTIAATISQAAKADAAKGEAVKSQRTTFDALLNTRIKLQKALGAVNEISALPGRKDEAIGEEDSGESNADAIKSAESAALTLWSTIEELRTALAEAHSKDGSKKRKRPSPVTPDTTSDLLWERMVELESESLVHRRTNLDKWSSKVRGTSSSLPNARGKLLGSASGQQSITAVLDAHVATELGDRSSKRSRVSNGTDSASAPEPVYDDTVFYQSLLRDLVEQRMSSSDAMSGGMALHQLPSRLPIHPVTGMRNDKVKRDIDTRASKGRKMRFNVHEKLQNFMAPEDRGVWTIRAREEFFASLLGRTASGLLGEGNDSASDDESDNDREEIGLKLFRS